MMILPCMRLAREGGGSGGVGGDVSIQAAGQQHTAVAGCSSRAQGAAATAAATAAAAATATTHGTHIFSTAGSTAHSAGRVPVMLLYSISLQHGRQRTAPCLALVV